MWYSADDEENVGKILSDLVKTVQESAKKLEDDLKRLKAELGKMEIDLSDEQLASFAPVLMKMMNDKTGEDKIRKTVEQLKKQVGESMRRKALPYKTLMESNFMAAEDVRSRLLAEAVCENGAIMEAVAERLLAEGWFGDQLAKIKNSNIVKFVKDKAQQLGKKLSDAGSKTLEAVTKYSIGPMLRLGGITVGAIVSGFNAELVIKAMEFVEKHGKKLKNTFDRFQTEYANSKGVITRMDYKVEGSDSKYSMRFYKKDMVWRVLNVSDQLKHPSKDYVKQIVNGETGKKYRERLKAVWDPLFSDAKGGKIDFVKLLEQAKSVDISESALRSFEEFAEDYDKILANCIESPKIDTRAQRLD